MCNNKQKATKKQKVQRVYSGPQGLAFCSGNSDRDGKVLILKNILLQNGIPGKGWERY